MLLKGFFTPTIMALQALVLILYVLVNTVESFQFDSTLSARDRDLAV